MRIAATEKLCHGPSGQTTLPAIPGIVAEYALRRSKLRKISPPDACLGMLKLEFRIFRRVRPIFSARFRVKQAHVFSPLNTLRKFQCALL